MKNLVIINNRVYFRIFDRTYKEHTGIYSKHKYSSAVKLNEIDKNINNIKSELSAERLIILKQVHGNNIIYDYELDDKESYEADGVVTTNKKIAISILTADCVPVLLSDIDGSVIGAAHCGWKSATNNIIANISKKMRQKTNSKLVSVIGPCIQQKSYEVDGEYNKNIIKENPINKNLFTQSKNKGKYMFDLPGYVKYKIKDEDIDIVCEINDDTYSMPEKYPSYRRSFHNGTKYTENILSAIIIK